MPQPAHNSNRTGLTLIELVIVVLILGILVSVAAPKILDTADAAKEKSLQQSLSVVRPRAGPTSSASAGAVARAARTSIELFLAEIALWDAMIIAILR